MAEKKKVGAKKTIKTKTVTKKIAKKPTVKKTVKTKSTPQPSTKKKPVNKNIKQKIKKPKSVSIASEKIKSKKKRLFRGRFGSRGSTKKISTNKWKKWRKPRGIDILFKREDGLVPSTGYGSKKELKYRHPSGYYEELVFNSKDVEKIAEKEFVAARIASTVGKRNRKLIMAKAEELKIKVLN